MTQPEEQQHESRQPAGEATSPQPPVSATSASSTGSEPTEVVEPSSPPAPAAPQSPPAPQAPSAAPQSPPAPAAAPGATQWPPAQPWSAQPQSAGHPQSAQPPGGAPVPLPPGWGQPEQPGQPGYQPPQDPFHTTTMTPTSAQLPYNPYSGGQDATQPGFTPGSLVPEPPKKKSKALVITSIVLGVVLLLCAVGGVGAFLLISNSEGKGAESAADAAQDFLSAVYKDHDGAAAEKLVCSEARDRKAIDSKIKEIQDQKAKLKEPRVTWDTPAIDNETAERADSTVTIKLTTSDEKLAEQTIKLTLVKHDGWFVCEVQEQKK